MRLEEKVAVFKHVGCVSVELAIVLLRNSVSCLPNISGRIRLSVPMADSLFIRCRQVLDPDLIHRDSMKRLDTEKTVSLLTFLHYSLM